VGRWTVTAGRWRLKRVSATEGGRPEGPWPVNQGEKLDPTALEGLVREGRIAIPNKRIAQIYVKGPVMLGYWAVGG